MVVEVISIDQHSSTADQVDEWDYETWKKVINGCGVDEVPSLSGGDAKAAQKIHGGSYSVKEVNEDDSPRWGFVWFVKDSDGSMKKYKTNYATS